MHQVAWEIQRSGYEAGSSQLEGPLGKSPQAQKPGQEGPGWSAKNILVLIKWEASSWSFTFLVHYFELCGTQREQAVTES